MIETMIETQEIAEPQGIMQQAPLDQPERPLPQSRVAGDELAGPGEQEVDPHVVTPGRSMPRSAATPRARS